ncbi:MAG TPA: protoporphyrinogen oxidase [Candidatus Polarisedimenticolaceae bacterium]|nr:protoporphyrinogen oxidase [Candidatus Polarisedimenticolaceae bacterium]
MSAPVVVIGGGVSGLAVARRLHPAVPVVVLEAERTLGGQVRTEHDGGFLLEGGADTLLTQKPWAIELCRALGLAEELDGISARKGGTEILHRGRLVPVPDGFLMMAPTRIGPVLRSPLFSPWGKLRLLIEPLVPRADHLTDESLSSFVTRRFGREVLERVAEPVIAGLYTADAEHLSLSLTMPRFLDLEHEHGSVTRGLKKAMRARGARPFGHGTGGGAFVALRHGMGSLIEALAAGLHVRTGFRVAKIEEVRSRQFSVHGEGGEAITASAVVFACPAYDIARIVSDLDADVAAILDELPYASSAVVHLIYRAEDVRAPLRSFGFFVPRTERSPILACSFVSEKFRGRSPAGFTVLRVFMGGATRPEILDHDDAGLAETAHRALVPVLRLTATPESTRVHRHPRAIPQYAPGRGLESLVHGVQRHEGLFVVGGAAGAVGIPDCVRAAEAIVPYVEELVSPQLGPRVAYQANQ